MSVSIGSIRCLFKANDSIDRSSFINSNSCSSSTFAVPIFATSTNSSREEKLQCTGSVIKRSERGNSVVHRKPDAVQRETSNLISPSIDHNFRRLSSGLGAACQGQTAGGPRTAEEQKHHINMVELKASKLAILASIRMHPEVKSIHLQMDNIVGLSYIVKMGGRGDPQQSLIGHKQRDLGLLATERHHNYCRVSSWGFESRSRFPVAVYGGLERMETKTADFSGTLQFKGTADIDLFASRVSRQLPCYISWKLDPFSKGRDVYQRSWEYQNGYAFPPFSLIGRVLRKVQTDQAKLLLVTPTWQSQSWYPCLIQMSVDKPILIPQVEDLLMGFGQFQKKHPLIEKGKLRLVAWTISGKSYLQKKFQRTLQSLSQVPKGKVQSLITDRPRESGIAGVVGNKLIPLVAL